MFEKFAFTSKQIEKYFASAVRDFRIAEKGEPEVAFVFYYNCLLKLSLAVCAKNGWRVKASRGHHAALIERFAGFFKDEEIEAFAQAMRSKRNKDLYGGGVLITKKEIDMYHNFLASLMKRVEKYLDFSRLFKIL